MTASKPAEHGASQRAVDRGQTAAKPRAPAATRRTSRLHTRYGPPIRSTAQGGLCRRASIRTVARPRRLPATGPTDHCPGGTCTHKVIAPFGAHQMHADDADTSGHSAHGRPHRARGLVPPRRCSTVAPPRPACIRVIRVHLRFPLLCRGVAHARERGNPAGSPDGAAVTLRCPPRSAACRCRPGWPSGSAIPSS